LTGERCNLVGFLGLNLLSRGCVLRNVDDFVLSVGNETVQDIELYVCQGEKMFLRWVVAVAVLFMAVFHTFFYIVNKFSLTFKQHNITE
jgi:hypothetical protein